MIEIKSLSKSFGSNLVLDNISLEIKPGSIFGLIGINGAGKSTLLRLLSGVYSSDSGIILFNNKLLFENVEVKKDVFFLPDEPYYSFRLKGKDLVDIYKSYYNFDEEVFMRLLSNFKLNANDVINNYSKGMKRQLFVSLAIACKPKYLFLDEAFDGLDPIARLYFKREIIKLVEENGSTVIISSHALRELEDICDSYGIIDKNTILSSGNIGESLNNLYKYQLAFKDETDIKDFDFVDVINLSKEGKVINISFRGDKELFLVNVKKLNPILLEELKVSFEDMFVEEITSRGYLK